MSDFNKGDFTQQGVDGHVTATLRLNEKRIVNIDLTSNEEAEGCTIAGTVTDLLNDKVYPIGSAPSGNIEITENGENINVAPYATATVNVSGGGGLKTANITFVPTFPNGEIFEWLELGPIGLTYEYELGGETVTDIFTGEQKYYNATADPIVTIPILTNAMIPPANIIFHDRNEQGFAIVEESITTTGDIAYGEMGLVVSGDGTVTCTLSDK